MYSWDPLSAKDQWLLIASSIDSGSGGTLVATFNVQFSWLVTRRIAIRTQNLPTGYFSYNWFYNNTTY